MYINVYLLKNEQTMGGAYGYYNREEAIRCAGESTYPYAGLSNVPTYQQTIVLDGDDARIENYAKEVLEHHRYIRNDIQECQNLDAICESSGGYSERCEEQVMQARIKIAGL